MANTTHDATIADRPRVGDWMITVSGRRFWPLDPRPADVYLPDIAHALAHTCRYGGHARKFYSVAEHSVLLANLFIVRGDPALATWALLHDAAEAYFGDVIRPVKREIPQYAPIEDAIARAIWTRCGLVGGDDAPCDLPVDIKHADSAILGDEAEALFGAGALAAAGWTPPAPLGVKVEGWAPMEARDAWRATLKHCAPALYGQFWRTREAVAP